MLLFPNVHTHRFTWSIWCYITSIETLAITANQLGQNLTWIFNIHPCIDTLGGLCSNCKCCGILSLEQSKITYFDSKVYRTAFSGWFAIVFDRSWKNDLNILHRDLFSNIRIFTQGCLFTRQHCAKKFADTGLFECTSSSSHWCGWHSTFRKYFSMLFFSDSGPKLD